MDKLDGSGWSVTTADMVMVSAGVYTFYRSNPFGMISSYGVRGIGTPGSAI